MRLDLQLAERLAPYGYNAFGVISRARFDAAAPLPFRCDALHPPARSVLIVATAGPWHWRAFLEWIAADPVARLGRNAHPLDAFTADVFARHVDAPGARIFFPTFDAPLRLNFVKMAELADIGRTGELGFVLVDRRFGAWLGLRAAIFTPEELPDGAEAAPPCAGCAAPCRAPGDPLARRLACNVRPDLAYDDLQRIYHYDRPRGRALLCERFGVKDEATAPVA